MSTNLCSKNLRSLPYDSVSPFGTYRPSRIDQFIFKLFQRNLLPRGFVFSAFFNSSVRRQVSGIYDVENEGIRLRIKPQSNYCERKFLRRGQFYDQDEMNYLSQTCRIHPNPVFIDVGANIGLYSFLLAKSVPNLRVLAIEPHPGIRRQFEYNLSLNPNCNIEIQGYAVSDQPSEVIMKTGPEDLGCTRIETEGDVKVECTTLKAIVEKADLSRIDALKVDVEGFESKVLKPYLQDAPKELWPRTIVVEIWASEYEKGDLIEFTASRGYKEVKRIGDNNVLSLQG